LSFASLMAAGLASFTVGSADDHDVAQTLIPTTMSENHRTC
jgi:hypothetical protein